MATDTRRATQERIEGLDMFRGVAILAVVAIHVLGHLLPFATQGSAGWYVMAWPNRALQFAVPAFLTLSAFLNIRPLLRGVAVGEYARRRLQRALWPYAAWTLVYLLYQYRGRMDGLSVPVLLRALLSGNGYYHLYFLLLALQLYVLLPVVAPLFRREPAFWKVALGTAALQGAVYAANVFLLRLPSPGSVIIWYLPAVALGCWLATRADQYQNTLRRGLPWALGITAAALAVYSPVALRLLLGRPLSTAVYQASLWVYATGATFLLLCASERLAVSRARPHLQTLGARSLEIFLAHPLVIVALDRVVDRLPGLPLILLAPAYAAACIFVPLGIARLVTELGASRWVWGTDDPPAPEGAPPPFARRAWLFAGLAVAVLLLASWSRYRRDMAEASPNRTMVFTSTRHVTDLAVGRDGTLWAATTGGLLSLNADGRWARHTTRHGLPSNDVHGVSASTGRTVCWGADWAAAWRDERWTPVPRPAGQPATVAWRGGVFAATPGGVRRFQDGRWSLLPPSGAGGPVQDLAARKNLLLALAGGELRAWDGRRWRPLPMSLPAGARGATCLVSAPSSVWVGGPDGLWEYRQGQWLRQTRDADPAGHDVLALAQYDNALYAATRAQGLVLKTRNGWDNVAAPDISTDAPRQMVAFRGALYVRHANGVVDRWDGGKWARRLWPWLPTGGVVTLAADTERLYVGQASGWSEFNGRAWEHHRDLPALRGQTLTALCPDEGVVWLGTRRDGLWSWNRASGRLDPARVSGFAGAYVTVAQRGPNGLHAGTRDGRLARWDGAAWKTVLDRPGQPARGLAFREGAAYALMGDAVWRVEPDGRAAPEPRAFTRFPQALLPARGGLWVGARDGLAFLRDGDEAPASENPAAPSR